MHATCFGYHTTHRPLRQKAIQLVAAEAPVGFFAGLNVSPVHLEHVIRDIQFVWASEAPCNRPTLEPPREPAPRLPGPRFDRPVRYRPLQRANG